MPAASSIDEVIARLDRVIAQARGRGSADGYFAALYRGVTSEVKAKIPAQRFEDGTRMERLVVIFASRYLDAHAAFEAGRPASACWIAAFTAARTNEPVVLQHLLLGMNAHINLDLGIAAAEAATGGPIAALQTDFNRINDILGAMIDDAQVRLARVWPLLRRLDGFAGRSDEAIANFSLRRARDYAWLLARDLAELPPGPLRAARILAADTMAAMLAGGILRPGLIAGKLLAAVRLTEHGSVSDKLDALTAAPDVT